MIDHQKVFRILKPWHRLLMHSLFSIEIIGLDHLPPAQPGLILAPKHISRWDPLLVSLLSPDPLRYVATRTEFKGIQGWLMGLLGTIPLDREGLQASTFHQLEDRIRAGETLVLFPEGYIRPQTIGRMKAGLARLMVRMERRYDLSMKVVPIVIHYGELQGWRRSVRIQILPGLRLPESQVWQDKQRANALTQTLSEVFATALSLPLETTLTQTTLTEISQAPTPPSHAQS